jgi:hypothetical protein
MRGLWDRARTAGLDGWLLAGMVIFTAVVVGVVRYQSDTALRYGAEDNGGMPPAVSAMFLLTIEAAVAAGLLAISALVEAPSLAPGEGRR